MTFEERASWWLERLCWFIGGSAFPTLLLVVAVIHRGLYSVGYDGTARDMVESQSGRAVFVIGVDSEPDRPDRASFFHRPDGNASAGHWDEWVVISAASPKEAQEIRDNIWKSLRPQRCRPLDSHPD